MGDARGENPVLFHLSSEIYKNGLRFDRDRTFRNRLIFKAIIVMAVLLVIATVTCVSMARSRSSKTVYNDTHIIKINRKAPSRSSSGSSASVDTGGDFFEDIETSFVPPPISYRVITQNAPATAEGIELGLLTKKTDKARRRRTLNSNDGFHSEILDGSSGSTPSPSSLAWKTAGDDDADENEKKSEGGRGAWDNYHNEESDVAGTVEVEQLDIVEIDDSDNDDDKKAKERDERLKKVNEVSKFWKGDKNLESIRSSQAKRMLSYMDLTVDPCDDFYQYACGNWNKNNPIPQDKAGYDIFELLRESLDIVLRDLLTEPSDNDTSEAASKAKDFYESCMNEEILEKRGNEPLLELIRTLGGWPILDKTWNASDFDWVELMSQLKLYNSDVLVHQWIGPDIKNSSAYIIQFDQTVLGLPSKDYFLKQSNSVYLEAYKKYMISIAVLLGAETSEATADAEEMVQFEKDLAKITLGQEERRNMSELYLKLTLAELSEQVPQIAWQKYLTAILSRNVDGNVSVVTYALKYFKALIPLIDKTDKRIVCNYLMWSFMRHAVNGLDKKFQDAKQEFLHTLFGREKAPLRWTYCVAQVNSNLGMALGSIFVQRYFDESSKNDTVIMTQDVMHSFRDMLNVTDWIDPQTKKLALDKINAMALRIGYPDYLLNREKLDKMYKNVTITKSLYFENTLNIYRHLAQYDQQKLGGVVNRTEWNTTPTIVNAYYSRNINQIMVPAGILQPPFYHKHFPKSLNYGGIGVAIGHEITHGFDDKGRLFDQYGNYHKWWKEETIVNFHRRAQCLIDQYGAYTVREVDMRIDGVNTQGENIADNGGIRQAFRAYERWLTQNDSSDEMMPGINATNFQLFFLNFAQIWCGGMRPEASRNKLKTALHSPGRFRVIGTLSNSEEFARVFNCPSNTTMNPVNKCSLW